jgi:carbamoyl-phosphate synthase large subunit
MQEVRKARTIAVTGLQATDNPASSVAVLRCLQRERTEQERLIAFAYDALDSGSYAREVVDDVFILPHPSLNLETFFERIREIHRRVELSVIVPTLDSELPAFVELEPRLRALGIATFLPTLEQLDRRSRANLPRLADRCSFRTPQTLLVGTADEVRRVHQRLGYPFFVKGPIYRASMVTDLNEAVTAFRATASESGLPLIVQACVEGSEREERSVVALGDGHGGLVGAVVMKKLAMTDKDKGWAGVTVRQPELVAIAERFARATHWRGPFELDVVLASDGAAYVIEINPWFPAWVYVAAAAGVNLPRRVVALASGTEPSVGDDYRVGAMFVRTALDQLADAADLEKIVATGEWHRLSDVFKSVPRAR